ncbi:ASST-domain-containing protein [Dactylonectria macrodidyma]|uniref:ASST-domain-containing protein n=1 Tax=Dactylonectria macrodidyma TaxID=307937 RepID=A0A9P9JGW1_9HYPO|nr:ASST-domain-containing protein [Dactylonectria macrodidyma]
MAPSMRSTASAVLSTLVWAGSSLADTVLYNSLDEFNALAKSSKGFPSQKFRSSDVTAPVFHVNTFNHSAVDDAGYIFMGSVYGKMGAGPMIFDAKDLSLVYADQHYDNAYTSQSQTINGTRYLVFWEGVHNRGHANGYGLVFNENYDLVYNVTASGYEEATLADMHEMRITDDSSALFTTYWSIPWNCTSLGGDADGLLMDSGFQEVDLATNKVLFSWAATDHFDVGDTYARYGSGFGVSDNSGFDFFHINSVDKTDDGNYLISSRHLSLISLISGKDGHPIWVLGGRRNQFLDLSDGGATNFGWQHDARFYKNQSHITMFDNHGEQTGPCAPSGCKTRGLHLEIDTEGMTARIVQEYFHPERINSGAMGGFHSLDNGNVIIGWGYNPGYVEYTPDGKPVMDIQRGKLGEGFQADLFAYRVSKHDWTGRPRWLPSAAIDAPHRTTENATVYLSWNGATDIASWVVVGFPIPFAPVSFVPANMTQLASQYANTLDGHQNVIAIANRTGFETEIFLGGDKKHRYMAAAALAADGTILGSTFVIDVASGQPCLMASHVTSIWPVADDTMTKFVLVGMIIGAIATISTLGRWFWRRRYHLHAWDSGSSGSAKYERLEPEERRID